MGIIIYFFTGQLRVQEWLEHEKSIKENGNYFISAWSMNKIKFLGILSDSYLSFGF